jgi:hypothetical protein
MIANAWTIPPSNSQVVTCPRECFPCVNIQGDSQSRAISIQLMVISSLSNIVKVPSPSCDEAATASTEWGRHHPIAWHYPRFASRFLFLPQRPLFGSIRPRSCRCRVLPHLGWVLFRDSPMPSLRTRLTRISEWTLSPGSSEPERNGVRRN